MSMLSLFRVVTLEDWTDVMYINMYGCENYGYGGNEDLCTNSTPNPAGSVLFFVSFVLIGTMIMLNLFIGVIMTGMDEAKQEAKDALLDEQEVEHNVTIDLAQLETKLGEMQDLVKQLKSDAKKEG